MEEKIEIFGEKPKKFSIKVYKQKVFFIQIIQLQGKELTKKELKDSLPELKSLPIITFSKYLRELLDRGYIFQPSYGKYSSNKEMLDKFHFDVNFRVKIIPNKEIHIKLKKDSLGESDGILVYNLKTNKGKITPSGPDFYSCPVCQYKFTFQGEYYEVFCPSCGNDDYSSFIVLKGGDV